MSWKLRSYEKEILDGQDFSVSEIRQNMAELNTINHWLGGHKITIKGFRELAGNRKQLTVCEIGCGGGDNLAVIYYWAVRRGFSVNCIGIDINRECIAYARDKFPEACYLEGDYRQVKLPEQPDIIFSSLFCHHFTNHELVGQLNWMEENCRVGFFINDLQRHPVAYYAIKMLMACFSSSRLVRNDAPLSVKRGFSRKDWRELLAQAPLKRCLIYWKWAFRWLVIVHKI